MHFCPIFGLSKLHARQKIAFKKGLTGHEIAKWGTDTMDIPFSGVLYFLDFVHRQTDKQT